MKQRNRRISERNTKQKLLDGAITLFAQKGYAGTAVREIVDRVGVTKPTFYYYFKNKEGVLSAILDAAYELQQTMLTQVLEMEGTLEERFANLAGRVQEDNMGNKRLVRLVHNMIHVPPQGVPGDSLDLYHRRTVHAIKRIYSEALARDELKRENADDVALLILGLFDSCFHLDYLHPQSKDPDRLKRLLSLAIQGPGSNHVALRKGYKERTKSVDNRSSQGQTDQKKPVAIVAIDFSPYSKLALSEGKLWARKRGGGSF